MSDGPSLQKISGVEIVENEGEMLFIYGKKKAWKTKRHLVRSRGNRNEPPVQNIKYTNPYNIPASLENELVMRIK